ncbi:CorA family divalent cation transporter [Methylobacterium sp. Leaf117]|uniref:CorA family divalent cation transporter n=1 Tax=Methylobacterium sp. Leaf117 TaxID=1736260 RepID=UPI0006FD91D8|nr:CorA family divalent cation transporter [Methylobacterium sp. Leaf117]KQP88128.1 magnesium transporter CorA [Methylobacterium sp. Leaf117]
MPRLLTDTTDLPCLLFSMVFDAEGRGRLLETGGGLPAPVADGFLWLHLDLVDARLDELIAAGRFGPPALAAATFARDGHQRVVIEGSDLGLVIADREREFGGRTADEPAGRLHCVLGERLLVSGRRHATAAAEAARDAVLAGRRVPAPAGLLELFVTSVAAALDACARRFSDDLDAIEDRMLDEDQPDDPKPLAPIRRQAVRQHRQLAGLSAVFHRLESETEEADDALPVAVVSMAARVVQRLDSLHRDMLVLSERSRLLQDEIAGRTAAETNRQLFTLSILTALFLPPTLVTGVFGMNTKGLFLGDFENGSLVALVLCGLAALAVYGMIRRLGLVKRRAGS